MLALRPNCELCDVALPPSRARCATCVRIAVAALRHARFDRSARGVTGGAWRMTRPAPGDGASVHDGAGAGARPDAPGRPPGGALAPREPVSNGQNP